MRVAGYQSQVTIQSVINAVIDTCKNIIIKNESTASLSNSTNYTQKDEKKVAELMRLKEGLEDKDIEPLMKLIGIKKYLEHTSSDREEKSRKEIYDAIHRVTDPECSDSIDNYPEIILRDAIGAGERQLLQEVLNVDQTNELEETCTIRSDAIKENAVAIHVLMKYHGLSYDNLWQFSINSIRDFCRISYRISAIKDLQLDIRVISQFDGFTFDALADAEIKSKNITVLLQHHSALRHLRESMGVNFEEFVVFAKGFNPWKESFGGVEQQLEALQINGQEVCEFITEYRESEENKKSLPNTDSFTIFPIRNTNDGKLENSTPRVMTHT